MIHPAWTGLGWATSFVLTVTQGWYSVRIGYALMYSVGSLMTPQPWEMEAFKIGSLPVGMYSASYFWQSTVLEDYPRPLDVTQENNLGSPQWRATLATLAVWFCIYLMKRRPLQQRNYLFYGMTVIPMFILTILFFRCLALDGAPKGVRAFFGVGANTTYFDTTVLIDATSHNLFSLSPGTGATITLASYARKDAPIFRIAVFVTVIDALVSFIAGMLVFAVIGSHMKGNEEELLKSIANDEGPSLTFVQLPAGLSEIPYGGVHCLLMFISIFFLGYTTILTWAETLITFTLDFLSRLELTATREVVAVITSVVGFLVSLPFMTPEGFRLQDAVDHYTGYSIFITCVLECLALAIHRPTFLETRAKYVLISVAPAGCLAALAYGVKEDVETGMKYSTSVYVIALTSLGIYVALILIGTMRRKSKQPAPMGIPSVDHKQEAEMLQGLATFSKGESVERKRRPMRWKKVQGNDLRVTASQESALNHCDSADTSPSGGSPGEIGLGFGVPVSTASSVTVPMPSSATAAPFNHPAPNHLDDETYAPIPQGILAGVLGSNELIQNPQAAESGLLGGLVGGGSEGTANSSHHPLVLPIPTKPDRKFPDNLQMSLI